MLKQSAVTSFQKSLVHIAIQDKNIHVYRHVLSSAPSTDCQWHSPSCPELRKIPKNHGRFQTTNLLGMSLKSKWRKTVQETSMCM